MSDCPAKRLVPDPPRWRQIVNDGIDMLLIVPFMVLFAPLRHPLVAAVIVVFTAHWWLPWVFPIYRAVGQAVLDAYFWWAAPIACVVASVACQP